MTFPTFPTWSTTLHSTNTINLSQPLSTNHEESLLFALLPKLQHFILSGLLGLRARAFCHENSLHKLDTISSRYSIISNFNMC